ncbi:TonB-dependent receptor plug domain-containing protein [Foetidibacter luteolus]|uniref:TonB-dependent receptor plug domain-containing protein n=1 Tax=Foetidibacter luteolus TaxID=2608880 RepID=UPI001A98BE9C|nr:TonB-dependent receptor [Foetidibacter luteolus]
MHLTKFYPLLLCVTGFIAASAQDKAANTDTLNAKETGQVTVVAKISGTTIEPGKIIYNTKDLPVSRAGSAGDILKFMPSVAVGGPPGVPRDIRYRGLEKSYSLVLIDGKNSGLTGNTRETILNQIPASAIDHIEIISNPGPEFDGEGVNGVINIVLKKGARQSGVHGNATASVDNLGGYSASTNLAYKSSKGWEFFGGLDHYRMHWTNSRLMIDNQQISKYKADGSPDGLQRTDGREKRNTPNTTLRAGFRFAPSKNSSFTAEYTRGIQQEDKYKTTDTRNLKADNSFKDRTFRVEDRHDVMTYDQVRLNYMLTFRNKSSLTIETNGLLSSQRTPRTTTDQKLTEAGEHVNTQPAITNTAENSKDKNIFTQADYRLPIGKFFTLQSGYKHSYRNRDAEKWDDKYNYNTGKFDRTQKHTDNFQYTENIHAAYLKGTWRRGRFNADGGLRYENTGIHSATPDNSSSATGSYGVWLPNLNLFYNIDATQYVKASIGRRIRRAGFKDLNPFEDQSDPAKYKSGNPDLKPEKAWLWEVGYLKNFKWGNAGINLFRRDLVDMISKATLDYQLPGGEMILYEKPVNVNKAYVQGLELMAGFNLFKWMDLQLNYSRFGSKVLQDSLYSGDAVKDQYDWSAKTIANFYLPTQTSLQFAWNAIGPKVSNTKKEKTIQYLDAAITQKLLKNTDIFLRVSDVFATNNKVSEEITAAQYKQQWQNGVGRVFYIGASVTF